MSIMDSKKVGAWDLGNLVSFATGPLQRLIFTVNPEGTKLAAYANKETDRTGGISGDFFSKNLLAPLNTFEVLDGGINVRDYNIETLRSEVSMVLQKNELFSGTTFPTIIAE